MFLTVHSVNQGTNFSTQGGILTESEAELASKYGFYFRTPHLSVGISNGAAPWQMFSVLWLAFLVYEQLWWILIIPVTVYFICANLRPICHPGFFCQEVARYHPNTPEAMASVLMAEQLQLIYEKLWNRKQ
jgi:hypothetical protein